MTTLRPPETTSVSVEEQQRSRPGSLRVREASKKGEQQRRKQEEEEEEEERQRHLKKAWKKEQEKLRRSLKVDSTVSDVDAKQVWTSLEMGPNLCLVTRHPPWMQPRGKTMVSLVNSHANATRIGGHVGEIDLRFAPGLPLGWQKKSIRGLLGVTAFFTCWTRLTERARESFIDITLVRIHCIIVKIRWTGLATRLTLVKRNQVFLLDDTDIAPLQHTARNASGETMAPTSAEAGLSPDGPHTGMAETTTGGVRAFAAVDIFAASAEVLISHKVLIKWFL